MTTKDFSKNSHFPGTTTSPFDTLVRLGNAVERLPIIVFAALLFALALIPTRFDLANALVLWLFMVGDWLLLLLLPRMGKSYGPAKPPTFLLALGRLIPGVLPFPLNWIGQLIGTALVIYGFWIEPHRITVTHQTLHTPKLKENTPPLRVLHLGDLHVERVTDRERQLVKMTKELKPDVILFSGDFLNLSNVNDPVAWEHARTVLRELSAPLGVFAVTGSPPVDQPQVIQKLLDGLDNIHLLENDRISIDHHGESIDIVGITCTHKPPVDGASLDNILHGDPDPFTILLYHTPDLAPEAAKEGVDLQLSGHTHGGQVRLPFFGALYTSSLYGKRFEVGRHQIGNTTLYVSRGIGMEGEGAPRVRFLCPPEVILWEISAPNARGVRAD